MRTWHSFIIYYYYCLVLVSSSEEGLPCNTTKGWSGVCKISFECLSLADLVKQGENPELCETGEGPIICCPEEVSSEQIQAQPLKQQLPLLLAKQNKKQKIIRDTLVEQSQHSPSIRKMSKYRKRVIRRRPCMKRHHLPHIVLNPEDDADHVKIRTYLKPIRAKRKPMPIRETIMTPLRKVNAATIKTISSSVETNGGSSEPTYSLDTHLGQLNLHSAPIVYPNFPFQISSPSAAAEYQFYGDIDQKAALLDEIAQSTARPSRSAQKSRSPAQIMCGKYSEKVTDTVAEISKNGLLPVKSEKCTVVAQAQGTPSQERKITPGQLPHVIGLGYKDNTQKIHWDECNGALISDNFVLTAAHCIHTPLGPPSVIRAGETSLGLFTSEMQIKIEDIVIHPQYNSTTYDNNIALLKLSVNLRFNDKLRPACLHIDEHVPRGLVVTHWTSLPAVTLEISISANESLRFADRDGLELQKTQMILANNKDCDIAPEMDSKFLCANLASSRRTLNCQGNGGDPLQIRNPSNKCLYNLVGLSVENICDESVPIAFVKVSHFVPWIESIVWP